MSRFTFLVVCPPGDFQYLAIPQLALLQMTENMFLEGLYQVFFKERPLSPSQTVVSRPQGLKEAHILRWFSTVVNTRLLITGVRTRLACHALLSLPCLISLLSLYSFTLPCLHLPLIAPFLFSTSQHS